MGEAIATVIVLAFLTGLMILGFWGCPQYNVWTSEMSGRAELAKAEFNRKIAAYDAEAEVARAKGVAEANKVIGDSLKGKEEYLRFLWINSLKNNQANVIYVPTEAGLPILEASRLRE